MNEYEILLNWKSKNVGYKPGYCVWAVKTSPLKLSLIKMLSLIEKKSKIIFLENRETRFVCCGVWKI